MVKLTLSKFLTMSASSSKNSGKSPETISHAVSLSSPALGSPTVQSDSMGPDTKVLDHVCPQTGITTTAFIHVPYGPRSNDPEPKGCVRPKRPNSLAFQRAERKSSTIGLRVAKPLNRSQFIQRGIKRDDSDSP